MLPARKGHARAFAAFALGEAISGSEAVSLGLANKMTPRDEVLETARTAALTLASKPLGSVTATKRLMRDAAALARQIEAEILCWRLRRDCRDELGSLLTLALDPLLREFALTAGQSQAQGDAVTAKASARRAGDMVLRPPPNSLE